MRFATTADIHIRSLTRHDEIREVFKFFVEDCKKNHVDHIFIGGDIGHTKLSQYSGEYVELMVWLLNLLGDTAPTHIILGNHDLNEKNKSRQDVISPIVDAIKHPNVHLYKNSGVYNIAPGYNLCVFSIFDEENWNVVDPVEGDINIACFHGSVQGAKTEANWELHGGIELEHFADYDAVWLGDIHKMQWLDHRDYELEIDREDLAKYPGAVVIL